MIKTIIGALLATISGHLIWILGLVNLAWLLIKDHTLFSWYWVGGTVLVFMFSVILTLLGVLRTHE